MNKKKFINYTNLLCFLLCSGCTISNTSDMKDAIDKLDSSIKIASDVLETERKTRPRIRRIEAIEYYIQTKNLNLTEAAVIPDFTKSDIIGSFARFACAGSGSMIRENNAMQYFKQYSTGLKDILEPGSDSLPSQYNRFMNLQKAVNILPVPEKPQEDAVQSCATDIIALLGTWKPVPTTDKYDENPLAAAAAIEAMKALHQLAVKLAEKYNDSQAKEKFLEYVNKSHPNFSQVMNDDLSYERLSDSWKHRKAVSLQQPLQTFRKIFYVDKSNKSFSDIEDRNNIIRELGLSAHKQLEEFDLIRELPSPVYIRQKIADSEDKLYKMTTDDTSIDDIISFLSSTIDDFNEIKKQYDSANDSVNKFIKTLQ